jgi:hypothetical protein
MIELFTLGTQFRAVGQFRVEARTVPWMEVDIIRSYIHDFPGGHGSQHEWFADDISRSLS